MNNLKQTAALHQSNASCLNVAETANLMARQLGQALRILRMKQLVERTGLSRATLYVLISTDPTFPKKIKLTERTVGFLESDVDAWIVTRAQSRFAAQ
ncbi:helix-turn-helix transcriptional regulator [Undibacterium sp. TJN25]|uniref:helix-turn-helix transcriptional regulator n=1 Tax=Undibacterium sp. TJN25 TaxID=3413056 RepID=UPI003BF04D67